MKRPYLVHFIAIESDSHIHVRSSLSMKESRALALLSDRDLTKFSPTAPLESLGLLGSQEFVIRILGFDTERNVVFRKDYESDSLGSFDIKFIRSINQVKISHLEVYEVRTSPGIEYHLGSFIPLKISTPKKIVISDFDKTLVDTRYSTLKEVFYSLRKPLAYFPSIGDSIDLFKSYIDLGFQPFIVTASPHFYENAIRDWLYSNNIFTAEIFLKDYRKLFSLFEEDLTSRDIKSQVFYKLNHIVNIILMTGVPEELILIGDGFESDTLIYLTIASLLNDKIDPWNVWNKLNKAQSFKLNTKQVSRFLSKFYQLETLKNQKDYQCPKIKIHIRCKDIHKLPEIKLDFLNRHYHLVNFYQA
ncbi:MAG: phosphatase domain-containing protein [Bacteriovoracaceae bacterium]